MKVCVIDPSLFTLPYDQHLCAGLREAGVDVTLCGRRLRAEETALPHDYPFERRCYPWSERGGVTRTGRAGAWLKAVEHMGMISRLESWLRSRFDVIHFQWSPMPAVDRWLWRRLARDRTLIFTVHDTTPFLGRPTSRWQQLGWRRLLDVAHGLIVHTEESRRELVRLGVPAGRITVIPHGPLRPAPTVLATTAGAVTEASRRTLLVFGEIKPYKGVDVLLRAAARIPGELARDWRIIIAGRPRCDLTELHALAAASRIPVEWRTGFVPDHEIAPLFTSADIVVFPYRWVDASGALMLALPFGVPVVATRVGVFQEMIEDGVTGLLAAPNDEVSLAAALETAMAKPCLREKIRANLLERVGRLWSWSAIARAHADCYQRHSLRLPRAPVGSENVAELAGNCDHRKALPVPR